MKQDIETMNKNQEETKNTISEMKNKLEGIKSRQEKAKDKISKLENKVGKNSQAEQLNEKRLKKNKDSLRDLQDNMKCNNICITGISEGEEKKQGIENLFEKIMTEDFPNMVGEIVTPSSGSTEGPNKDEPKRARSKIHHN